MKRTSFIYQVQESIDLGLPGESAHMQMDPMRPDQREEMSIGKTPRQSAVLILWHQRSDEWQFPLIQRPVYNGTHSGQVALPGGKQEGVESYHQTALRETQEELGIDHSEIEIIGELSEIYIPPSNFNIKPVIGITGQLPVYKPDVREVAGVFDISMKQLLDDANRRFAPVHVTKNIKMQAPCFDFEGHVVWGATAMILSELAEITRRIL